MVRGLNLLGIASVLCWTMLVISLNCKAVSEINANNTRDLMKKIQRFAFLAPIVVSIFLTGCATPNATVQYTPPVVINPAYTQETNGLRIIVDPVFDPARSKTCFNADALSMGILPIHVFAENNNPNASFLIQKQNLKFTPNSGSQTNISASGTDVHSDAGSAIGTAGVVLISAPLIFAGGISVNNASVVQHNFVQAEFRDQTLSPGQSTSGFVYFQILQKRLPAMAILKLTATDLRSRQNTRIEIPITNESINK